MEVPQVDPVPCRGRGVNDTDTCSHARSRMTSFSKLEQAHCPPERSVADIQGVRRAHMPAIAFTVATPGRRQRTWISHTMPRKPATAMSCLKPCSATTERRRRDRVRKTRQTIKPWAAASPSPQSKEGTTCLSVSYNLADPRRAGRCRPFQGPGSDCRRRGCHHKCRRVRTRIPGKQAIR